MALKLTSSGALNLVVSAFQKFPVDKKRLKQDEDVALVYPFVISTSWTEHDSLRTHVQLQADK
jgi:hypothetical protein